MADRPDLPDFTIPRNVADADRLAATARDFIPMHVEQARYVLSQARSREEALGTLTAYYQQQPAIAVAAVAADALLRLVEEVATRV